MFSFITKGMSRNISSHPGSSPVPAAVPSCRLPLHWKQEVGSVWIHASSLVSFLFPSFSIPSPVFFRTAFPATALHRHKHHLLSRSSLNCRSKSFPKPLPPAKQGVCARYTLCLLSWGRTEPRRALGLGLHRMNNFPLKVTHFLFSVFRQSGPMGRL